MKGKIGRAREDFRHDILGVVDQGGLILPHLEIMMQREQGCFIHSFVAGSPNHFLQPT